MRAPLWEHNHLIYDCHKVHASPLSLSLGLRVHMRLHDSTSDREDVAGSTGGRRGKPALQCLSATAPHAVPGPGRQDGWETRSWQRGALVLFWEASYGR